MSSAHNNLALAYKKSGDYARSLKEFVTSRSILDTNLIEERVFSAVVLANEADCKYATKEYEDAYKLVQRSIKILSRKLKWAKSEKPLNYQLILEVGDKMNRKKNMRLYADSFFKYSHSLPEIKRYEAYLAVLKILETNDIGYKLLNNNSKQEFSDSLLVYYKKQNRDIADGLIYYKTHVLEQQNTILDYQRNEASSALAVEKAKLSKLIIISLAIVLILCLMLFYTLDKAKRKRQQIELEKKNYVLGLENESLLKKQLENQLKAKTNDVLFLALDNSKKYNWNSSVIQKLKELRKTNGKELEQRLKEIELEMNLQLQDDSQSEILKQNIDKVGQEFEDKLIQKIPSLTKNEIELCGFIKLKLSGQEIASIRNVDPKSITKAKQRLKKKLAISNDSSLDIFLKNI